jgi:hypothetical protein
MDDKTHPCPICGCSVPDERTELTGAETCIQHTFQRPKPLGIVEYAEKAGGVLFITEDRKVFEMLKRPANRRR